MHAFVRESANGHHCCREQQRTDLHVFPRASTTLWIKHPARQRYSIAARKGILRAQAHGDAARR
jgi:hypothetical protein